jgi:hypothetical protein
LTIARVHLVSWPRDHLAISRAVPTLEPEMLPIFV